MNGGADAAPLFEARSISKRFPGVVALQGVSLTVQRGEVLALLGENGAGKSTLMKILAGVQPPDAGQLLLDGTPVTFPNVASAQHAGVALIHQELNLAANLDIACNLFLGREPQRWGWLRQREMHAAAATLLQRVGLALPPDHPVRGLSIAQQQLIEIAKALSLQARLIIMDEPTSSLAPGEVERLFEFIAELKVQGTSIIYNSHRLHEVERLADRAVVLRDGANAGELSKQQCIPREMVRLMVGRNLAPTMTRVGARHDGITLGVHSLRTRTFPDSPVSFTARAGEMIGLAGLLGAGRTELLRAVFGVDRPAGGAVWATGRNLRPGDCASAIAAGLAYCPEDRKADGVILPMTIEENIGLPALAQQSGRSPWRSPAVERRRATDAIQQLSIRAHGPEQPVRTLSGGNQQKVVLAKWLQLAPRVLLLDEPTRGIDVGARAEIYRLMFELADRGMTVIFASSEMEEILTLADRALVLRRGTITGELSRDELSEEAILKLAVAPDSTGNGASS